MVLPTFTNCKAESPPVNNVAARCSRSNCARRAPLSSGGERSGASQEPLIGGCGCSRLRSTGGEVQEIE